MASHGPGKPINESKEAKASASDEKIAPKKLKEAESDAAPAEEEECAPESTVPQSIFEVMSEGDSSSTTVTTMTTLTDEEDDKDDKDDKDDDDDKSGKETTSRATKESRMAQRYISEIEQLIEPMIAGAMMVKVDVGEMGGEEEEKNDEGTAEFFDLLSGFKDASEQPVISVETPGLARVHQKPDLNRPVNVAVPRKKKPRPPPPLNERSLVLSTHLVPSLPVGLFEILAEAIEVVTEKPVALLYEARHDRPVAKDIVDIAVLPCEEEWSEGELLPVSFVFAHPCNKDKLADVYVDVLVSDRASHVEWKIEKREIALHYQTRLKIAESPKFQIRLHFKDGRLKSILDLRGYRCALPDRCKQIGAASLLLSHLRGKGENSSFFGNILDADTQVAALQMLAGKQVEVGALEAPVVAYHKHFLPGIDSLHILTSLGPLPPYRIMLKKGFPEPLKEKITKYLLAMEEDEDWIERLSPYGITGFAEYSSDDYYLEDMKSVATSVPYY